MWSFWNRGKKFLRKPRSKVVYIRTKDLPEGTIIDRVPAGFPEETPKDAPVVIFRRVIGRTGINATELRWRTWILLNQAASCYRNMEYYGCVLLLQSALESWLAEQFESRHQSRNRKFQLDVGQAKQVGIVTEEEAKLFAELAELRNTLAHSLTKPWMTPQSITEMTEPPRRINEEFVKSAGSRDLVTLGTTPEVARRLLARGTEMFRRRYPTDRVQVYLIAQLIRPSTNEQSPKNG